MKRRTFLQTAGSAGLGAGIHANPGPRLYSGTQLGEARLGTRSRGDGPPLSGPLSDLSPGSGGPGERSRHGDHTFQRHSPELWNGVDRLRIGRTGPPRMPGETLEKSLRTS